jgi:hypothetical protein
LLVDASMDFYAPDMTLSVPAPSLPRIDHERPPAGLRDPAGNLDLC